MGDSDRPQSRGEDVQASPRSSFSVAGQPSNISTSTSVSPSTSSSSSHSSTKTAVSECLSSWLNYLQMLNSLCTAGFKLSQSLSTLAHCNPDHSASQTLLGATLPPPLLLPMLSGWDELGRATAVATSTVKLHVVGALQEFITHASEGEVERAKENNNQIIADNISTLINLQYQFCMACFDCLSSAGPCPCCQSQPHEQECSMVALQQCFSRMCSGTFPEVRSQTSSPHFGMGPLNLSQGSLESPKGTANIMEYRPQQGPMVDRPPYCADKSSDYHRHFTTVEQGSGSTQGSLDGSRGSCYHTEGGPRTLHRGPSPVEHMRGPSPIQGFLDTIRGPGHIEHMRGPFPNPGQLLTMKGPFHGAPRSLRSPLHFPLFPLNGQRRWSEAAAAEVGGGDYTDDSTMRRWSMPWDSSKAEHSIWSPARGMSGLGCIPSGPSKLTVPSSRSGSDRSRSTTPDSNWQTTVTSQDGLAEAIQLLSFRPGVRPPTSSSIPPAEPWMDQPATGQQPSLYSIWSGSERPCLPFIRLPEMPEQCQLLNTNPNTNPSTSSKPP